MKNIYISYVLIIFFMIFAHWQCSSDSIKQKLPSSCQTSQKEINIAFPLNSIFQNTHLLAQVCKMNAEELYIGFNRQSHRLEWFGLNDEEVKGFVKVPKVGPNEIPLVHSFYFHNQDSIFIAGIFRIIAMNKDGEVWFSKRINESSSGIDGIDFREQNIYNTPGNATPLHYSASENSLYFAIKNGVSRFSKLFFEGSLLAKLDLTEEKIIPLPIFYPEDMKGKLYPFNKPNFTILEDKILYNFQSDSRIFIYDKIKRSINEFQGKTNLLSTTQIPAVTQNQMQDDLAIGKHISSNPQFLAITYDRNRDLYYRLTVAPYDGEVSNNRAGTRGRLFISVYDRNFELTHEEKKKDYRFIPNLMTSNGLMLIPNPNLTEEDAFKSLIFTAKCPN